MLRQCNVLNVVEVGSTDAEQDTSVSRDCRTVRKACANQMTTVCIDTMTRKHTLSQELPLTPVVPKPSEKQNAYKAKEALISQTCP